MKKHLLILGTGSVGKRHLGNLVKLGCEVSAMDPRRERLNEAAKVAPLVHQFTSLEEALSLKQKFSGVIIASPPKFHVEQSIAALRVDLPVFLEKPVSPDISSAAKLVKVAHESRVPLLLGYTYRWWPPLLDLKKKIVEGMVGKIRHVRCVMSAHLADWHPWERYQDFFMASRELGGGALLDESHFLDLILWFFGAPSSLYARVEKLSDLDIETDDNVDALLDYPNGLRVSIHLDLFGRPHEKFITISGEGKPLHWSFEPNRIRFSESMGQEWEDKTYSFERNDMFVNAVKEFIEILDGRRSPSCTIDDGYAVMRTLEAMRESSKMRKVVTVN